MRRPLTALGAALLVAAAPLVGAGPGVAVGPAAPTSGLVLHYAMESLPSGTVLDDSVSGLDGQVRTAGAAPRLVTSLRGYGKALELTGSQHQYVDVPVSGE